MLPERTRPQDLTVKTRDPGESLAAELRLRAAAYAGPEMGPVVSVELVQFLPRLYSQLYRFRIVYARGSRDVFLKRGTPGGAARPPAPAASDRPRILPVAEGGATSEREYAALARIGAYYDSLGDPRFGVVRVLDLLREQNAFVMEAIDEPSLRAFALHNGRLPSRRSLREVCTAFRNCGAWLRAYHRMPSPTSLPTPLAEAVEFVEFVEKLSDYVGRRTSNRPFFSWVSTSIRDLAPRLLEAPLPIGVAHSDYAMRNVLVGGGGRVTVLDTPARYRTCVYRDIGMFLTDLQWSRLPAIGGASFVHLSRSDTYRTAFLDGYFGSNAPVTTVLKLYEAQALLERFASYVSRCMSPGTSPVLAPRHTMWSAYYTGQLRRIIAAATADVLRRPA